MNSFVDRLSNVQWDKLDLPKSTISTSSPSVSLYVKDGAVTMNRAAIELIPSIDDYNFISVLLSSDGKILGLKFEKEDSESVLQLKQPIHLGKPTGGRRFMSRALMVRLFGDSPTFMRRRYTAHKTADNILAIDLESPTYEK